MEIDARVEPKAFRKATHVFDQLSVIHDLEFRSAALNMAIDEALLEETPRPAIRFYRWDHPALSFEKFSDIVKFQFERDLVRRWTGGGIVFHGEDLTYTIIIPAPARLFGESSRVIYATLHLALSEALNATGRRAELAGANVADDKDAALSDRRDSGSGSRNLNACFARPVLADVLVNGRKVAGAAQRRTRQGLLHQGSIQNLDIPDGLAATFADRLSGKCSEQQLGARLCARAKTLATLKYGTESWLQRR
jgi:lipoyl(octanoyl) transferase